MDRAVGKWYLAGIAAAGFVLLGLLAMLAMDRAASSSAMAEARTRAEAEARILAAGMSSELDKFSLVPQVLASDPEVQALLAGDRAAGPALNRRLAALARQTGAAAIYLIDAKGDALAASNWNLPTSFVGTNYTFRRYFREAYNGGASSEFALGTISRRPGLYLAQRVTRGVQPVGVVALKVEFDALEQSWRDAGNDVFVTDADGIVLITSNPQWRFRTTRPPRAGTRDPAEDAVRFGVASLKPVEPARALPFAPPAMIERVQPIAGQGWDMHLLADPAPRLAAAIANGRLLVLGALVLLGALAMLLFWWQRRRAAQAAALLAQQTATLRDQLSQANRLATLGQVTAGIGHEIRQPVAAMRVYAENGERLLALNQPQAAAENFSRIVGLTATIGQITEELLRFSRRGSREARDIPLAKVIDGALLLLHDRVARHQTIIGRPDPVLAQTMVRAEHVRLEQVLVNLLQNALDAAPRGSTIAIDIAIHQPHCHLSVSDQGPGLSEDARARLFHPFATTKDEGLGLGLVISQDIMRSLNGDLRFEPTDSGARFVMVIPCA